MSCILCFWLFIVEIKPFSYVSIFAYANQIYIFGKGLCFVGPICYSSSLAYQFCLTSFPSNNYVRNFEFLNSIGATQETVEDKIKASKELWRYFSQLSIIHCIWDCLISSYGFQRAVALADLMAKASNIVMVKIQLEKLRTGVLPTWKNTLTLLIPHNNLTI